MKTNTPQKDIPSGWLIRTLADLGEFKTGGVDKKIKQGEKPVRLVNYMDVYKRRFIDKSIKFMEVSASDGEIKTAQVKAGDMLFTPSSETPDDIGHSAVVAEDLPNTLFSYHLARLRFNEEYDNKIDLNFRAYFCNSRDVLKQFEKMSVGATRYTISKGKFESIQVLIPKSKTEQQKIAEILGAADEDIAKTQEVIEATKKLKRGLMQQLFTRGIGHTKFKETELGEIPAEWNYKKLNEITRQITDGTHRTPKYTQEGVPFLRVTDIQTEKIDWSDIKHISLEEHKELIERCKPEKGDVLLSKNGTIGITKVVDWDEEFSIFVSLCLIKPDIEQISAEYLCEILRSDFTLNQVKMRSKQGTVTNLHLVEIRDFDIPVPKISEQKKIIEILSAVDEKISVNKKLKEKLTLLKKGLMQDLLSGNKRTI